MPKLNLVAQTIKVETVELVVGNSARQFEDCYDEIIKIIKGQRHKWQLDSIAWLDYSDIEQILLRHIWLKWGQYDQSKSLGGWVVTIVKNQMINLSRNVYQSFVSPCHGCASAEGGNLCRLFETSENPTCPLYARWIKTKQSAYNTKLPVALENHTQEVFDLPSTELDYDKIIPQFHIKIRKLLSGYEYKIYKMLYIDNIDEEKAAQILNYKTTEPGRYPGYKQLRQVKNRIMEKAQELMDSGEVDIY
mgnify:CR=1 FL=1